MKAIVFFLTLLVACTDSPVKSLCIMRPDEGKCWVNKEENKGFDIKDMDGWFSVNEDDFRLILRKLQECQNTPTN